MLSIIEKSKNWIFFSKIVEKLVQLLEDKAGTLAGKNE